MRRIVAIGGGEIRTSETYEIDAHIVGDTYRVLSSDEDAGVHRVYKRSGKVVSEIVQETEVYQPIRHLLEKSGVTVQI